MKIKYLIYTLSVIGASLLPGLSYSQNNISFIGNEYSVLNIPTELRKNASAVLRLDETRFTIKDINNARMDVHQVVTILNEDASRYLDFVEFSDKFRKLEEAEVNVYDASGKKMKSYSKKDMVSGAYGSGMVEDGKYTHFQVNAPAYPITIEHIYTIKYNGLLDYPDSFIQVPGVATQHFLYVAEVDNSIGLRYRTLNIKLPPTTSVDKNVTTYTWKVDNQPAIPREAESGPSSNYYARLELAPNKFKMMNYEGDMTSWKSYGEWTNSLIKEDNKLNATNATFIRNLVAGAGNDIEKARIIYNYLQKNMRYVSIQLGIGGWKPFSADFVQDKKYGDCKALSNYMKAALDAVNVKSIYAIVNAGENGIVAAEDFPSSPFNHIILCIPQTKDSVWLECTSNISDFGVLGNFTENRKALLVTENGGVLVNTPGSKAENNRLNLKSVYKINEDWGGSIETRIEATGEFKESMVQFLKDKSGDDKLKYVVKSLRWTQPDNFTLQLEPIKPGTLIANTRAGYDQVYSMKIPSKVFMDKKHYRFFTERIPDNKERKQDYYFSFPFVKTDTTIMIFPEGYVIADMPKDKNITNELGTYTGTYQWEASSRKFTIINSLTINQVKIAAADYAKLFAFARQVQEDVDGKLVIAKE